ncbi:aspartate/glutamate racemase family protein [Kitasatospora sp. MAP5-34]|uniref:glutamate racemase n=1 Tax=Kitasatospora sp. MAP5-34 TaxID=3035102 RepID=UPI002473215A|nr:aspartate/glutamate racemase family protein [Kitasatospora sp. MAP5-34]MDH6576656.1 glutamate racemase [Kitasatospora sp. MAP5-34]
MTTSYLQSPPGRGVAIPRSRPVVIYDSGVGGLTVARHLVQLMPSEDLLFVADNGWFPYGDKNDLALRARIYGVLHAITESANPRAIVIACNTASTAVASSLDDLGAGVPIFPVIPPVEQTAQAVRGGTVALLGTPSTTRRSLVRRLIEQQQGVANFELIGSMELVHLAEKKLAGQQVSADEVTEALDAVVPASVRAGVDGVILACTHFPWLLEELQPAFPNARVWSDPARDVARKVMSQVPARVRSPREDVTRVLNLTSSHNRDELGPVFARHGFWAGPSLAFGSNVYATSLQTG